MNIFVYCFIGETETSLSTARNYCALVIVHQYHHDNKLGDITRHCIDDSQIQRQRWRAKYALAFVQGLRTIGISSVDGKRIVADVSSVKGVRNRFMSRIMNCTTTKNQYATKAKTLIARVNVSSPGDINFNFVSKHNGNFPEK